MIMHHHQLASSQLRYTIQQKHNLVTAALLEIFELVESHKLYNPIRVESGSNDLDNLGHLGHLFGGSSGSHPQTKLSGCDPDITCSLENIVGIW